MWKECCLWDYCLHIYHKKLHKWILTVHFKKVSLFTLDNPQNPHYPHTKSFPLCWNKAEISAIFISKQTNKTKCSETNKCKSKYRFCNAVDQTLKKAWRLHFLWRPNWNCLPCCARKHYQMVRPPHPHLTPLPAVQAKIRLMEMKEVSTKFHSSNFSQCLKV